MGIAAVVEGKFNQADAEVIDHSPSVSDRPITSI